MDDGYFHGINKMKKPGFKVIKPPGGQTQINIFAQDHEVKSSPINACQAERNSSSIAFGNNDPPVKHCTKADRNSSSIVFGGPELPSTPCIDTTPQKNGVQNGRENGCNGSAPAPAPAPVSNGTMKEEPTINRCEPTHTPSNNEEMHTPQNDNSKNNAYSAVRSSTKVIAPPGGRSSINLFGP